MWPWVSHLTCLSLISKMGALHCEVYFFFTALWRWNKIFKCSACYITRTERKEGRKEIQQPRADNCPACSSVPFKSFPRKQQDGLVTSVMAFFRLISSTLVILARAQTPWALIVGQNLGKSNSSKFLLSASELLIKDAMFMRKSSTVKGSPYLAGQGY